MKILLTNDDGVHAPGIRALSKALEGFPQLVVAPAEELSGCSHRTTTDRPLSVVEAGPDRYAVDGTPVDCVRVALHRFGEEIGWVLSGINSGGNLGLDVYQSGTVAAVREALFRGLPGVAVSHYRNRPLTESDWDRAVEWVRPLLRKILSQQQAAGRWWNINLPSLDPGPADPPVVYCPLDTSPLPLSYYENDGRLHYDGRYSQRQRTPGADVDVCFGGSIAVTEIPLARLCG